MAAMPRVTRRYDQAAANKPEEKQRMSNSGAATNGMDARNGRCPPSTTAAANTTIGSGYAPVMAADPTLHAVTFKWVRACPIYTLRGSSVTHSGGAQQMNRPVIGDLAMPPATGRYYYEVRVNTASFKIGLCTQGAYPTDKDLEACELGQQLPAAQQQQQQPKQTVAVLDGETSRVFVNGKEVKQLWRLFIATCGALFSFVVDTDDGVVQLFVDKKYAGVVFDGSADLRGKTLYPCVGIAGLDTHNRSIGTGKQSAVVNEPHKFDCLY